MTAWYNAGVEDGNMAGNDSGMLNQSDVYSWTPLDRFCGSPLWNYYLTIATDHPDVTSCFQSTILVWIPCGFLLVSSVPYTLFLSQKKTDKIPHSWLNVTKSILGVCLAILAAAQLVIYSLNKQNGAYILSAILRIIAMVLVVVLVQLERHRGRRTSSVLALYWFLTCISSVIIIHSAVRRRIYLTDVPSFIIICCYHACAAAQLILSLLVDKWSNNMKGKSKEKLCPYYEASVLSRLTFSWTFSMILKGYRKSLEEDDLWDLRDDIKCQTVVKPLLSRWTGKMLRRKREDEKAKKQVPDSEIPLTSLEEGVKVSPPIVRYEPSFFFTILRAYWFSYFILILLRATQEVLLFSKPQVLKLLLGFVRDHTEFSWRGYMYAILMFVLSVSGCLVGQHLNYVHQLTGTKIRIAIMSMIYRKALKLSHAARAESTVGEIVNLMSVDAQRFMELAWFINMVWAAPVQVALALYFLYGMLGPAIFAGLGVMILIFPINAVIVKINKRLHVKHMKQKDARMKMMNEILSGIKVLKLYAWELSFEKKIRQIRHKELSTRKMSILVHCCAMLLWSCSPFLVALASFGTYTLIYPTSQLDAQKIFVSLALLNLLKVPLKELPGLISHMVQLYVSVQRLSRYLKHEEMDPDAVGRDPSTDQTLIVENGSFGWNKRDPPLLKNIDLNIKEGSLVAVVGVVGAGKSSLLSAVLGEMEKFTGRVNVKGTVAYVAQQAWIQQETLKNNILFHNPERSSDYTQLINHCALQPDLDILPAGDATEIGEKGINLSGGQKLRVSLARAVYHEADIYILDDPLSAVDAHVGKHIFQNVIGPNGMLKNKTRIMVTHGISFLPKVDQIVVIVDGRISETGSYRELLNRGGAFAEFLENYLLEHEEEAMETGDTEEAAFRQEILSSLSSEPSDDRPSKRLLLRQLSLQNGVSKGPEPRGRSLTWGTSANRCLNFSKIEPRKTKSQHALASSESRLHSDLQGIAPFEFDINEVEPLTGGELEDGIQEKEESGEDTKGTEKRKKNLKDKGRLIEEERAEKGKVKLAVYTTYLKAIGIPIGVLLLLIGGGHVALDLGSSVWLSVWSDDALRTPQNGTIDTALRSKRLAVYTVLGLTQGIMAALQEFVGMMAGLRTSRIQHERLLRNILSCPMSFFDRTPVGRLLNRFGKDVDTMDGRLPRLLLPLTRRGFHILGSLIIISTVTPWILLVCAGLSVFYLIIQRLYVTSQRQLNRILSNNRSPIYANFSETLTGVSTIRAYRREELFVEDSMERLNRLVRSHYPIIVNNRWLGIVLQSMGAIIVLVAATFAVAGRYTLTPGTVGLAITYALTITGTFNWMVRTTGQVETQIVAVERVKEYCDVPTEAAWDIPETRPDADWPDAGKVEFRGLSLRYRKGLDLVLKDVDFHVKPSEKVGIVGRTGAGKSSLTLSLFRLLEAADGAIYIDGVNIAEIGLHDLRSKLTIIPQDPVLFSGTLRMNLDPFERHTDDEIWTALQHSHLDPFVSSLPDKLLQECSEGGSNLSVGQRQLVCLARALLRKTKVLVLDEATAAVDLETDDFIQSTIRTEFKECTVLTIAHRLNTILDYDRVMVLDRGEVKELDAPQSLLSDKATIFYKMAKDAGLAE